MEEYCDNTLICSKKLYSVAHRVPAIQVQLTVTAVLVCPIRYEWEFSSLHSRGGRMLSFKEFHLVSKERRKDHDCHKNLQAHQFPDFDGWHCDHVVFLPLVLSVVH